MAATLYLNGGPYDGQTLSLDNAPGDSFALGIDHLGVPCQADPPFGLALYVRSDDPLTYKFRRIKSVTGQPFPIEFADGPAKGFHQAPQPAAYIKETGEIPVLEDGKLFQGVGEPAGAAIYERRRDGDQWRFFFLRIDTTPEAVSRMIEEVNERIITEAMGQFYLTPDYNIYSIKPTEDHVQVEVQVGHRRAQVDERIAKLIEGVWRLGMDTLGSCQERPASAENAGRAYIGFVRESDAKRFCAIVEPSHIEVTYKPQMFKVANRDDDGTVKNQRSLPAANVLFAATDIDQVTAVVEAAVNSQ